MQFDRENLHNIVNGILFVFTFAFLSIQLAEVTWIKSIGINSTILAIILGIFFSNTFRSWWPLKWASGIQFSSKQLLRFAIILYGFRVSFQEIASVGVKGLILDVLIVAITLIVGTLIGVKVFKMDRQLSLLISAGAAICGAAAVLAVESVLKSEPYKASVAVGTVVLFGTLAMFLYPLLQHLGLFGMNESQFGIMSGASIHEVAQVVVAGNNISTYSGNLAVIVKMTRVLLLVPVLIILSFYINRSSSKYQFNDIFKCVPLFALMFIVITLFNSLHVLPTNMVKIINQIDVFLLTMAMAAIGMETNLTKLKTVGLKPIYLASVLCIGLMTGAYCLIKLIHF